MTTERDVAEQPQATAEGEILMLIVIGSTPHIAINLIVPALPAMAHVYDVSVGTIGLSVTSFLVGFGGSLPLCGPLADSFGRRKVLLVGLSIFILSSLACVVAPSAEAMIALRALAGCSAAAATVVARALLRDGYDGGRLVRATAYLNAGMASVPALGPLLGALLFEAGGWRLTAGAIGIFGAATLALGSVFVKKAAPPTAVAAPAEMFVAWRSVLKSRTFILMSLVNAFQHGTWWVFLASSAELFLQDFGLSPTQYGLIPPLVTGSYMVGSMVVARFALMMAPFRIMGRAFLCQAAAVAVLVALPLLGVKSVWAVVMPEIVISMCVGVITAVSTAQSLQMFPERAGAAAGLNGSITMLTGAACTGVVSAIAFPAYLSMSVLILGAALISLTAYVAAAAVEYSSTPRSNVSVPEVR
jgi:DHA1 family bicyclomycin/chloramphenicol resistance-like MFS transporter